MIASRMPPRLAGPAQGYRQLMPAADSIPTILARREISRNRFLSYVEEDLTDRHGKPYTYYQVESRFDAVVVVPVLPVERIYRHPYRQWLSEFPAGGIEPGEDPCAAGIRELAEETGFRAGRCTSLHVIEAMPGLLRMRLHLVLAEDLTPGGELKLEEMELLEIETLTRDEAWTRAGQAPASMFLTLGLLALERWQNSTR